MTGGREPELYRVTTASRVFVIVATLVVFAAGIAVGFVAGVSW